MGDLVRFPSTQQTKNNDPQLTVATDGIELLGVFITIADPSERRRVIEFARIVAFGDDAK